MTKQEKTTALNMARFIRSQTLTLLEKPTNWTRMNRQTSVNRFTTTPMSFTAVASLASGMTVKTSDACSSRGGHSLSVSGCREQTSPSGRVSEVLAGVGAQP